MALRAPFLRRSTVRALNLDKQRQIDAAHADALAYAAALTVHTDMHPVTAALDDTLVMVGEWAADDLVAAAERGAFDGYLYAQAGKASVHARQALDALRSRVRPASPPDSELGAALTDTAYPSGSDDDCCGGACDGQGTATVTSFPAGATVWGAPLGTPEPGSLADDDTPGPGEPHGEWQLLGTTVDSAADTAAGGAVASLADATAAHERIHSLLNNEQPVDWGQVADELVDVASSTLSAAEHLYGDGYAARIVLTVPGPDGHPVDPDDADTTTVRYVGGPLDGKVAAVGSHVQAIQNVADDPLRPVMYDVHRTVNARYGIAVYRQSIEDALATADDGTMRIFGRPLPVIVDALKAWDAQYDHEAWRDGYEFALRNLHDDAVQADLNRIAPNAAKIETTLRGALLTLPQGVYDGANRYHTDDQQVLHLWGNGQSFDVTWPRETADPVHTLFDAMPPAAPHGGLLDAAVAAGRINPPAQPTPLRTALAELAAVSSLITLANAGITTIERHVDPMGPIGWTVRIPAPGGTVAVGHGDTLSKAANDAQRIINAALANDDLTAA